MEADDENDFPLPVVPRKHVKSPPSEGFDGVQHLVECTNEECDFYGEMGVDFGKPIDGTCPECGGDLRKDFANHMWGIDSRGAGFHGTKIGQKIKRDRIARSEKLAKTQWDNHDPGKFVVNPERIRNPTEGGVYDPNSRFNKHKKKAKIILPKGSGSS